MSTDIYYFDHAAATPVDRRVIDAMLPFFSDTFYNPSSPYQPAVSARREYEAAKARLAHTFGAKADEVVITAGATESIHLAIHSFTGHIVSSAIEHDAVLAAVRSRDHTLVRPTTTGVISPESVQAAIRDDTELVTIQLANNEIGTVQPIKAIAEMIKVVKLARNESGNKAPLYFHCDASQGFGQIDVHTARLGVDLLTLNAAKMYGPKQVALLWAKPGTPLQPLLAGGGQERGIRSGTENVAGTIGFAMAAERAFSKQKTEARRLAAMRDTMQRQLQAAFSNLEVSGHSKKRLPGSLHLSIAGLDAERVVFALENKGVFVATGSACAANKGTRSHVLTAIGMSEAAADGSLRLTLGRLNNEAGAKEATAIITQVIETELARAKS